MAEFIEKQAARPDAFCEGVSCQECPFLKDPINGGCRVDDFIMALPAADVRPVVRGRWIPFTSEAAGDIWYCSACDVGFSHHMAFCPHCGADMREET